MQESALYLLRVNPTGYQKAAGHLEAFAKYKRDLLIQVSEELVRATAQHASLSDRIQKPRSHPYRLAALLTPHSAIVLINSRYWELKNGVAEPCSEFGDFLTVKNVAAVIYAREEVVRERRKRTREEEDQDARNEIRKDTVDVVFESGVMV